MWRATIPLGLACIGAAIWWWAAHRNHDKELAPPAADQGGAEGGRYRVHAAFSDRGETSSVSEIAEALGWSRVSGVCRLSHPVRAIDIEHG